MGIKDEMVQNAESTVRRHEKVEKTLYLTYNPAEGAPSRGHRETCVVQVRLPKNSTNVSLHGPGHFDKRGHGTVYGAQITFTETTDEGKEVSHNRTIELPHPVADVQLLDRVPDEAYKSVA